MSVSLADLVLLKPEERKSQAKHDVGVLTNFKPRDRHEKTSNLSKRVLDELVEYLLCL